MKYIKILVCLATAFIAFACTNEPVDIHQQLTVTISPSQVLDGFDAYEAEHKAMYEDDDNGKSKLRITSLLYDVDGRLVEKKEGLLNDYNSDFTVSFLVSPEDKYTLLCFSSAILGSLESPVFESYTFEGVNNLKTLKVIQDEEMSYSSSWSVLGSSSVEIFKSSRNINVDLTPSTAFIYLRWLDIHANSSGTATNTIPGTYVATATDYSGEDTYTWEIEVEQEGNEVIVKNLSPFFATNGMTADLGYNIFTGYIEDNYIIIPQGQSVGMDYDGAAINLYGVDKIEDGTIYVDDIRMKIGNGKLTAENGILTYIEGSGWLDLIISSVDFISTSATYQANISGQIDRYAIAYHANDIVLYDDGFYYDTTLSGDSNMGDILELSDFPNGKNVYNYINLLPGEFETFARAFSGNESEDYSHHMINVEPGKQYCLEFDCKTLTLNLVPGPLKSAPIVADFMDKGEKLRAVKSNSNTSVTLENIRFNGSLL